MKKRRLQTSSYALLGPFDFLASGASISRSSMGSKESRDDSQEILFDMILTLENSEERTSEPILSTYNEYKTLLEGKRILMNRGDV